MTHICLLLLLFSILVISGFGWMWFRDALSPPWRFYYLYRGFKARRQTGCPTALQERNDIKRLLYLMPYVAASFTPVILIVPQKQLLLASLGYLYWRILDTFDDLLTGEDREKGLSILYDRLRKIDRDGCAIRDPEVDGFHFSNVGPRDEIYIMIVKNLDRLDSLFLQMNEVQRDVMMRFVKHQAEGFRSVPDSHFRTEFQYHEKCVSTIMPGLYLATFEVNRNLYRHCMEEKTEKRLEDVCEAFETGNIIKDLEKDFRQGISYHPELVPRGIFEEIQPGEIEQLAHGREYLTYRGIQHLPSTCAMFENEWNETFLARFMALLLKTYLLNHYKKYWGMMIDAPFEKQDTKRVFLGCLLKTLLDWKSAITEVDQRMLSWRPNVEPLWANGEIMEKS